jgi:methylamine dehydrogenase accessory protein MauD
VVGPEVGMTYQIGKLPYAALIDKTGTLRAKGLVNSREHLDSLFEVEHLKKSTLQEYLNSQPQPHGHDHDHSHGHSH